MSSVKVAVLRYHFRLEPDTELQADLIYTVYQTFQASRKFLFINHPVSQAAVIIISLAKPAVVHDQHLNAYFFSLSGNFQKLVCVKSKISSLPVIDQDRSSGIFKFTTADILADGFMIISGKFSHTF